MMANRRNAAASLGQLGFTLMEVLVGLTIATVIVGGVMGLMSVSLQYTQRVREKARIQPVLEAAAQEILANPKKALDEAIVLGESPDAPKVNISATPVEKLGRNPANKSKEHLFRVILNYRGHLLEFSLLIPQSVFR